MRGTHACLLFSLFSGLDCVDIGENGPDISHLLENQKIDYIPVFMYNMYKSLSEHIHFHCLLYSLIKTNVWILLGFFFWEIPFKCFNNKYGGSSDVF